LVEREVEGEVGLVLRVGEAADQSVGEGKLCLVEAGGGAAAGAESGSQSRRGGRGVEREAAEQLGGEAGGGLGAADGEAVGVTRPTGKAVEGAVAAAQGAQVLRVPVAPEAGVQGAVGGLRLADGPGPRR
jgi:hypothetical protein